jgi:hypothetical protein
MVTSSSIPQSNGGQAVTARNAAHGHRTAAERAFAAADWVLGRIDVVKPTERLAGFAFHVSAPYVRAALAISKDPVLRSQVVNERLPLLKAANSESLVSRFVRATPAEWLEVARTIGADVIWDAMIIPIITGDRNTSCDAARDVQFAAANDDDGVAEWWEGDGRVRITPD